MIAALVANQPIVDAAHELAARMGTPRAIYQRQLTTAIKRARFLALVPYSDLHKA